MNTMSITLVMLAVPCLILMGLYLTLREKKEAPGPFIPEVNKYWYCGEWYMYRSAIHDRYLTGSDEEYRGDYMQWPVEGKILFDPFSVGLVGFAEDEFRLIDGLIPAMRVGDRIGLYRITYHHPPRSRNYDGLSWDNGCKVDLVFERSIKAAPMSNKEFLDRKVKDEQVQSKLPD